MSPKTAYRVAVGLAIATPLWLFVLIGAVGVIGAEGNPADRMYVGVLGVEIVGVLIARLRAPGMALAMVAAAVAQMAVAVVAIVNGEHRAEFTSIFEITALNGFFMLLFLAAAWLFRRAGHAQRRET